MTATEQQYAQIEKDVKTIKDCLYKSTVPFLALFILSFNPQTIMKRVQADKKCQKVILKYIN